MAYIGNTAENFETIEDRKTYTANGTTLRFGVLFSDSNVSVFQNGIKLKETDDYTVDSAGTYIQLTAAPSSGDVIDLVGFNAITSLAQNSHIRETFTVSGTAKSAFTLTTNIAVEDNIVVYLNGVRLHRNDYALHNENNIIEFKSSTNDAIVLDSTDGTADAGDNVLTEIMLGSDNIITENIQTIESRPVGDVIDVDIVTAGFRTSNHNAKSEVGTHLSFENKKVLNNDITVANNYNMLMVGPLTANATVTVSTDASLTIV